MELRLRIGRTVVGATVRELPVATERTCLARLRSGLTALAVGLAAGKPFQKLSSGASWPYELLGAGYGLLGVAVILYGHRRHHAIEAAVRRVPRFVKAVESAH